MVLDVLNINIKDMKQEEKDLLLRDLSARLPYGVICSCIDNDFTPPSIDRELISVNLQDETVIVSNDVWNSDFDIKDVKPYLRPMSSMTEEEKEYIKCRWCYDDWTDTCDFLNNYKIDAGDAYDFTDWLNAHHFDYRGLIEKGLAIEAPKEMYNKIKEEKK